MRAGQALAVELNDGNLPAAETDAEERVVMQVSMFGQLSGTGSESPIDATIANLAMLRDEGFKRVWMSQLPYEPDLLTILAIALHEVDTIEVASGVVPIQNQHPMQMAQRALTVSLASGSA